MTEEGSLPWRVTGLHGARSDCGPTYDGGHWTGGGELMDKTLAVRLWTPRGRPASVELDLGDDSHGCTVSLTPERAREAARALGEAADRADAEMARWRELLDRNRAELLEAVGRDMLGRAGRTDG